MSQPTTQESEITLELLRAVEGDASLTQRSAAQELGIALGLVNTYFKRCIKKGLIKAQQVPANRYAYYLTPKGFAEKSRLTAEFLSQSLSLFRQAQDGYRTALDQCVAAGHTRVALIGASDLAQIVLLLARDFPLSIVGVVDADALRTTRTFHGSPVCADLDAVGDVDAVIITGLRDPQHVYDSLTRNLPQERVLAPQLLGISTHAAANVSAPKGRAT